MNYYKRHLGDYAKDTKTISIYEHGVYTVVLDYYYSEEGPVSDEDVEALCRPQSAKEKLSVDKVMRRYFKRDGALWRHSYADRVIADWQEKSAKAAESADKRWHSERNANASAPVMPPQSEGNASHKPLAISQEEKKARKRAETPCPADWIPADAWQAFVEHRQAKRAKLTAKAVELIVADLDGYRKRGAEPRVVLEWAIKQGHTGLFFKPDPKTVPTQARPPSCARCAKESTRRLEGDYYCDDHKPIERVGPHVAALAAAKRVAA